MKLLVTLGVPEPFQESLDLEPVRQVFPYGQMQPIKVSSRVHVEAASCSPLTSTHA